MRREALRMLRWAVREHNNHHQDITDAPAFNYARVQIATLLELFSNSKQELTRREKQDTVQQLRDIIELSEVQSATRAIEKLIEQLDES